LYSSSMEGSAQPWAALDPSEHTSILSPAFDQFQLFLFSDAWRGSCT
jgi:hypothetical protein